GGGTHDSGKPSDGGDCGCDAGRECARYWMQSAASTRQPNQASLLKTWSGRGWLASRTTTNSTSGCFELCDGIQDLKWGMARPWAQRNAGSFDAVSKSAKQSEPADTKTTGDFVGGQGVGRFVRLPFTQP